MHESLEEQIGNWCKHFNGNLQNKVCRAGIGYEQVKQKDGKLPCLLSDGCIEKCVHSRFKTKHEVAEEVAQAHKAIADVLNRMASGFCPHCGAKIEQEMQVGRCAYLEPCGHRGWQGKARNVIPEGEI